MRLENILLLIYVNWELYAVSLIFNIVLCYFFFKRYIKSLVDPLVFRVIGVCFANTIPLFMWLCGEIKIVYFFAFILIEVCFWLGFRAHKPNKIVKIKVSERNRGLYYTIFFYSITIIIIFRLYFYLNYGLPILMENREDKYVGAEGLGGLDRLTYILEFFCLIYSFANIKSNITRVKLLSRFYLAIFTVFCVVEGSKGALISILGPLYFYLTYVKEKQVPLKKLFFLGILVLTVALGVMMVQGSNEENVFNSLLVRFMMFGDCYYEGFGYDAVNVVKIHYPVQDLLKNILAPFRLMDYSFGDSPPTIQIHHYIYPELGDINAGPNNRVPLLYYCFFGTFVGAIVAFFSGFIVSSFMYRTFKFVPKNLLGLAVYASIYTISCNFITDPILSLSAFASIVFGYIFLCFIYFVSKANVKSYCM